MDLVEERFLEGIERRPLGDRLVRVIPGMDGPNLNLTAEDIRGRIVWNIWVGSVIPQALRRS